MYSLAMVPLVLINIALVVWLIRSWLQHRDWLLLVTLLPMLALPYDTGIVALGSTIGQGDLLRVISAPRMNWFYLTIPLLLIIAGGIARRADFSWAQPKAFLGVLGVIAFGFFVYDSPRIFSMPTLYPACFEDVVRYVTSVKPEQACTPGQPGIDVAGNIPWGGLVGMVMLLIVGILLWWKRQWPWMCVGAIVSSIFLGMTNTPLGPLTTFIGDSISLGSIVWTAIHFSQQAQVKSHRPGV